ncbi:hypothetical protein BpHYR1_040396, partial [Brachionus plicatilis]
MNRTLKIFVANSNVKFILKKKTNFRIWIHCSYLCLINNFILRLLLKSLSKANQKAQMIFSRKLLVVV